MASGWMITTTHFDVTGMIDKVNHPQMALHFSDFQVSELIFFSARYIIYIYLHTYIYIYTYPINIGCIPMIFPLLVKSPYISEIFWPDSCPVIFPQHTRRGNCSSLPPSIAMVDISWLTTDNHQLSYYHIFISYHIVSYRIISYHIISSLHHIIITMGR